MGSCNLTDKKKELKTVEVSFEEFADGEFVPKYAFYFKTAMNTMIFIGTRVRQEAQDYCDDWTGVKGKYKVIASRDVKSKSKLESGGQSVIATATRSKPSSRPPK